LKRIKKHKPYINKLRGGENIKKKPKKSKKISYNSKLFNHISSLNDCSNRFIILLLHFFEALYVNYVNTWYCKIAL